MMIQVNYGNEPPQISFGLDSEGEILHFYQSCHVVKPRLRSRAMSKAATPMNSVQSEVEIM